MRPQFHHIDAKTIQDRTRARRDREALSSATGPSGPAPEARVVQLVNKSASSGDAEGLDGQGGESTKEYLNKAMEEQWTRLKFFDEEAEEAYEAYHGVLFHNRTEGAVKLVAGMGNEAYVDAISAPRLDPSGKTVMRPMVRRKKGGRGGGGGEGGEEGSDEDDEDEDGEDGGEGVVVGVSGTTA